MVKVISLSDEAYGVLARMKENKSFSELVLDLVREAQRTDDQASILDFAGKWKGHMAEWEEIKQGIYSDRKRSRTWSL